MKKVKTEVLPPLFLGGEKSRRLQCMAKVHESLGSECAECLRVSDLVRHSRWNPSFSSWRKKRTDFEVHHPDHDGGKFGNHRLGDIYVPSADTPGAQYTVLDWWTRHLVDCHLLCWSCHMAHHQKVSVVLKYTCFCICSNHFCHIL